MATDTKIVLKRSDVSTAVPNLNYVEFGELAFNYRDEKLYYRSYDVNGTTEIIKNYDFQRVIPVAKGGTGATTAAVARENLGAAPIFSPAFIGTASLASAAVQPTISISSIDADAQRAIATVAYVRAEIADDAPTKTGGGATGTWGINVTGNAGTATKLATARTISQGTASDINFSYTFDGSGNVTPNLTINSARASNIRSAAGLVIGTDVQAYDADLKAIGDLTGTSGFLKKTAANTWSLDTEVYTPTSRTITIATSNGIQGGLTAQDLSANRVWTLGLTDTGVVANTYNDNATSVTPFTVDVKGRITGTGTPVTITPAFSSITGKPTTLSGYGIVDALDVSATGQTKAGSLTASSFIRTGGLATEFLKADGSSDGTPYTPAARTLTVTTGNGITGGVTAVDLSANRAWTLGLTGQALNVHNLATDGFFVRSTSGGTSSIISRSIVVGSGLSINSGDGTSGNPTIGIATGNLSSLRDITTGGFLTRTAASTLTPRSITVSGTGLSVANADGVSGNPTITSNATSSNTVSTLVARDASGAFSAGAITGSSFVVSGTVNTTLSGSATGTAKTLTLPNTTGTIAVLADIPDHSGGAATTISAADGRVLSAIVVNALGHTTSVSSKTLASADIPSLDTSKITTGTFDSARISDETVTGKVLTGLGGLFFGAEITSTDTILQAFRKLQGSVGIKANTASPSFTGTVTLPTGTASTAPLRFVSGTNLTSPVAGSVEFNGTNLFITNSSLSRKTLAYTDSNVSSATTATTATSLATARTISQGAASDINFSYTFDGSANITPNLTINTSRASNIRSALGLEIGTNVQAYDADLAAIAALGDGPDADTFIDTGYLRKTGENTWIIDQETTPPNADENTTISGDVIGASALGSRDILNAVLATVNSSPGTYNNSATAITPFTVDGKGRVTSTGSSVTILPDWSSIANKPTTLSGYAITDAQALNSNLTAISTLGITGSNGLLRRNADNSWSFDTTTYVPTSRTLTIAPAAGSGITVTPSSATDLSANRSWSLSLETGNLTQLRDLGANTGIIVHNGTTGGGMITRSISVSTGLQISNNDGVAGNPMISLAPSNLTSLFGLTTGGFLTRTASNTLTPRTITIAAGSTGLSITNGDGVSGNPTLTLSSSSTNIGTSLVARDASGNFSAGTITATLSGNASSASTAAVTATDTTNATYGIVFASGTSGGETLRADLTGLSFNPSTNTLTAGSYSGDATLSGTPTAPTAAASTNTTQIATTAFVLGQAANTTPLMDGVNALAGSSTRFARADHVHQTDSTRAPLSSPAFSGTPTAPTAAAGTNTTQIATTAYVRGEISSLIGGAPAALDTLNELAAALANDASYATTITTALAGKEPTITAGTTGQYWRGDKSWQTLNSSAVGLGNVNNTSDANKPVSTAQQTALDLKANLASPTFTGTVSGITATMVGLGNVTNESKAIMFTSPTFTGSTTKIGSSTTRSYYLPGFDTNYTSGIQGVGNSYASPAWLSLAQWSTSTTGSGGAFISLNKSNGVEGTQTIVSSGQRVGGIGFAGSDGAKFLGVADVYGEVDATPTLNSMPGRLVFATTADGFTTPSERMRITRQGRVGIWTTNPSSALDVNGTITATAFSGPLTGAVTGTASGNVKQGGGTSQTTNVIYMGWSAASKLRVQVDTTDFGSTWPIDVSGNAASVTGGVYTTGAQTIGGVKTFSDGILVGGSTVAIRAIGDEFAPTNAVYNEGTGSGHYKVLVGVANRNDSTGATIVLGKSRGTAIGSNTIVQANDQLGEIRFAGADGTDLNRNGVSITAGVDGTPTSDNIPGRLVFSTAWASGDTADNGDPVPLGGPIERMRITRRGRVGIGTTNPSTPLHVNGTITSTGLTTGNILSTGNAETYGICSVGRYTAESEFNVRGGVRFSQRNGDRQFYSDTLYSQSAINQTYDIPLSNFADWITLGNMTNVLEIRITNVREAYTLSTGATARLFGAYSAAVVIDKYVNTNGYIGYTVNGAASVNITTAFGQGQSSGMPATVGWASIIATRETTTADGTVYLRLRGHTTADTASIQYSSTTACFIQSYAS